MTFRSDNLADAQVVEAEVVADVLHGVAATRVNRRGRVVLLRIFVRTLAARIPRTGRHSGAATVPTIAG